MRIKRFVVVRFTSEGFHCWPDADGKRAYLSQVHRHLFHIEAKVAVSHGDRAIELQDLRDMCMGLFGSGDFGSSSCEDLAFRLASSLQELYGSDVFVSVFEDGELGGEVWLQLE